MNNDADPAVPLCAIIVFDKGVAYRRALRVLVGLDRLVGGGLHVRLIPWRLEEFDFSDHRTLAMENAREADVVLISMTSDVELPVALREWLLDCAPLRNGRAKLLVVALLAESEQMDPLKSSRYQFIKRSADEAGFDFLAPPPSGRCLLANPAETACAR